MRPLLLCLVLLRLASSLLAEPFPIVGATWPTLPFPQGEAKKIAVAGGYAYLGGTLGQLVVVEVKDPRAPRLIGTVSGVDAEVLALHVQGQHLYVGTRSGVLTLDLVNPAKPSVVADFPASANSRSLSGAGQRVAALLSNSVAVFDVINPHAPRLVKKISGKFNAALLLSETQLLLAERSYLQLVEISQDGATTQTRFVPPANYIDFSYLYGVGNFALAATRERVYSLDTSHRPAPSSHEWYEPLSPITGLVTRANRAYLLTNNGLEILGLSPLRRIGQMPGALVDLALDEQGLGYAITRSDFRVLDLADPSRPAPLAPEVTPTLLGKVPFGAHVERLSALGQYLVATEQDRLVPETATVALLDATNPTALARIGTLGQTFHRAPVLATAGQTMYLADTKQFQVVDCTDVANPTLVGSIPLPEYGNAIAVAGDRAYVTADTKMAVVGLADPTQPQVLWQFGAGSTVGLVGTKVVAVFPTELQVLDVADPVRHTTLGRLRLPGGFALSMVGQRAFLSARPEPLPEEPEGGIGGLYIIDLRDPAKPRRVGRFPVPAREQLGGVAVAGDRAYLLREGLDVLDISNPALPRRLARNATIRGTDILWHQGRLYVAAGGQGLLSIDFVEPTFAMTPARLEGSQYSFEVSGTPGFEVRLMRRVDQRRWEYWKRLRLAAEPSTVSDFREPGVRTHEYRVEPYYR